MRHVRITLIGMLAAVVLGLAACTEETPSGPTVHCFNADANTGKVTVTCPVGE